MKKGIGIIDMSFFLYKGYASYIKKEIPEAIKPDFEGSLTQGLFAQDESNIAEFIVNRFLIDIEKIKGKGFNIDPIVICMDCGKSEFRKGLYPDYKSQRKKMFSEAFQELKPLVFNKANEIVKEVCPSREWVFLQKQGVEADDLIYIVCKYLLKGQEKFIIASDRDLWQIIDDTTSWITFDDFNTLKEVTKENFSAMSKSSKHPPYRNPKQYLEGKFLCGDKGDNINGIPLSDKKCIGDKSAWSFIQKYGSIENIIKNIVIDEEIKIRGEESMLEKIRDPKSKPIIELNKKLMDISIVASNIHLVQNVIDMFNFQIKGE